MRSVHFVPLAVTLALGCGTRTDLPCAIDALPGRGDGIDYECDACEGAREEPLSCQGAALIWTSPDDCIDDGGSSGVGDLLEVYCVDAIARFCLSHEDCPWRTAPASTGAATCSTSGLESTFMATMIRGCDGFQGYDDYCCSPEGRIGVSKR